MLRLMLFFLFLSCASGGSPCPPRVQIYPCLCLDRPIGKSKYHTTVICRGLDNGESLKAIDPALSDIEVDHFLLYDSYWPTGDARMLQMDSRIPVNHLNSYRMKEVEIVDTTLSVFGCPIGDNCRTSYLKKFTAINSTVADKASCNNNGIAIDSWISCPGNVEELIINKGFPSDLSLKSEFFPEPMSKLKILHLPNNNIARIDRKTFTSVKFPVLQSLDLSHNSLRDVKSLFTSPLELKELDLSYNNIRSLVDFQYLPKLRSLKLRSNQIIALLEYEWQQVPSNLRLIDLSDNSLQCNCGIKWINSTFHINAELLGSCVSPPEVKTKKLRKASRYFLERCDENGNVGPKIKHV